MPKILGNQVLQLQGKYLKVNFRFLQENCKRLLVSKAKNLIGFVWFNHSCRDHVLSPRYGFLQRTITEQSVEETTLQVPSLEPRLAIFIDM